MVPKLSDVFADLGQTSHREETGYYITEEVQNFIKYFQKHIHEQVCRFEISHI